MSALLYKIPENYQSEIDDFEKLIESYKKGTINETELKARRVPFGVYEQRKKGTYMVRIRCTAGIITPVQLKKVAEISLKYASGILHVTTRQEIQIHDVDLNDLISVIRDLSKVGLSTRGGGGNTVRNITASWDSGISKNELFDVTPYAISLTNYLISKPDSWLLPRKYKIAFSNNEHDSAFATIQDLGFIAQVKDGVKGFKVFVAGGMGRSSQVGNLLHDFIPEEEIFIVAEAIKKIFSQFGNRKNKHAARLRFLWNSLGKESFVKLYNEARDAVNKDELKLFSIPQIQNIPQKPFNEPIHNESIDSFQIWKRRFVQLQKSDGAVSIRIPLLFGLIYADKAKILAELASKFGENTIRLTSDQNVSLRNIPEDYLGNAYWEAKRVSELSNYPVLFGNSVACAGASTCQLGICRARGALGATVVRLKSSPLNIDNFSGLRIHFSGCSNSCGQHGIADLGFAGKVGRRDQDSYPVYTILGGAHVNGNGNSKLATKIDEINARDLPVFIEEFLTNYNFSKSNYNSFTEYLDAEGKSVINTICEKYRNVPSYTENRSYYRDWDDSEKFTLAHKSTGECSAGLFDLIEIDLERVRQLRKALEESPNDSNKIHQLAIVSSRMLLITRGVEAKSEKEVFFQFEENFINKGLISERFRPVVKEGIDENISSFIKQKDEILALSDAVEKLYLSMDNTLQFKVEEVGIDSAPKNEQQTIVLSKDFRGVACPMNFVKTKMALSTIKTGELLEIQLDDGAPIENVPKSVQEEGHSIVKSEKVDKYWNVVIKKK